MDIREFENLEELVEQAKNTATDEDNYTILYSDNDMEFAEDYSEALEKAREGINSRRYYSTTDGTAQHKFAILPV